MFDGLPSFTGDTLIHTVGVAGTSAWFEDPDLSLSGGEVDAGQTRLAVTDGVETRAEPAGRPATRARRRHDVLPDHGSAVRQLLPPDLVGAQRRRACLAGGRRHLGWQRLTAPLAPGPRRS